MKKIFRHFILVVCVAGMSPILFAQQPAFPLKWSTNNRYLVDQNNQPFPILGRTAWFLMSQPVGGYTKFIQNTIDKGYNSIEISVLTHDARGEHPPFNGNGDAPFLKRLDGKPWNGSLIYRDTLAEAPDITTPNEAFWKYIDTLLNYCESNKMMVFFFPAYVGYDGGEQGWMQELLANGAEKTEAYGKWIATRYKDQKNIVWMLLGDMGFFTPAQRAVEGGLIRGLKSVKGVSVHYSAEGSPGQNSADQEDFGNEMTLNGTYTWGKTDISVPRLARRAYAHCPVIPAYLLEEPYDEEGPDGNNVNPNAIQPVRRFQWWGWLNTIGGYISGNGFIWPFKTPGWEKHLDTKGSFDMARLNKFIRSVEWWKLVPSGLGGMKNLITSGGSVDSVADYVAAAANPDGSLLIAYVPPAHKGSITVDMTMMRGPSRARWFDPTNPV